jgi:outer membrane lipoprotein SlyB
MVRTLGVGTFLALAALLPAQRAAAQDPVAGAIVGGTLGGIVGGVLGRGPGAVAGAAIGATTGPSSRRKHSRVPAVIIGGAAVGTTGIRTAPDSRCSRRTIAATDDN